jgi:hypothetical protein
VKVRDPGPRRALKRTIITALKRTIIKSPKTKRNDAWMWIWGGAARTEEIEKRDRRNGYSLGKTGLKRTREELMFESASWERSNSGNELEQRCEYE